MEQRQQPPSWVEDAVDLAIAHAPSSGASIPTFASSPSPTNRGIIHYVESRSQSNCSELPNTVWACADNNMGEDDEWHITFLEQGDSAGGGNIDWCEAHNPDHVSSCVRADRIAIHELGHVLDLDHYPGGVSVNSDTVMRSTTPKSMPPVGRRPTSGPATRRGSSSSTGPTARSRRGRTASTT